MKKEIMNTYIIYIDLVRGIGGDTLNDLINELIELVGYNKALNIVFNKRINKVQRGNHLLIKKESILEVKTLKSK